MSKFLSVQCQKCKKKLVVYGNATETVHCECGEPISSPSGGRARVNAKILEVLS